MLELGIRLTIWLCALGAVAWRVPSAWDLGWRLGAAGATLAVFAFLLDRRDLRVPGFRLAHGLFEAAVLGWVLTVIGLLPYAGAALGLGAFLLGRKDTLSFSPLFGGAVLALASYGGYAWSPILYGQAAGALVLACLAEFVGRPQRRPEAPEIDEAPSPFAVALMEVETQTIEDRVTLTPRPVAETPAIALESRPAPKASTTVALDRLAEFIVAKDPGPAEWMNYLVNQTCARGLALFTVTSDLANLAARHAAGDTPYRIRNERLPYSHMISDVRLKATALTALHDSEDVVPAAVITLRSANRLEGLLWVSADSVETLEAAREAIEGVSGMLAANLVRHHRIETLHRSRNEWELRYEIATVAQGAETPRTLFSRVVREFWPDTQLDFLSIGLVDSDHLLAVTSQGTPLKFVDALQFDGVAGLPGWLAASAPETVIEDAHTHSNLNADEAVRRRLGSAGIWPIFRGEEVYGAIIAASHRKGGLGVKDAETLQTLAQEISHAVSRIEGLTTAPHGQVTPVEFQSRVAQGGILGLLEPLRGEDLLAEYGEEALEAALRKLSHRLRSHLPPAGSILWREKDILVHIPGQDLEAARRWSNQAVALASASGIRVGRPDSPSRLSIRAKVSLLGGAPGANIPRSNTGSEAIPA